MHGTFVAVQAGDARDQRVGGFRRCLEDCGSFLRGLDRTLPAVDRAAGPEDVDAGGEAFLDDRPADALGLLGAGEDAIDRDDAHSRHPPEDVRAPDRRGDDQRADRLVKHGEPDRDAGQHGHDAEHDLRAERGVDRARRPPGRRRACGSRRAKMTSAATVTQAHQRWMKWIRYGSWVSAKSAPFDQSTPSGKRRPCMVGQSLATWPALSPATQAPKRSCTNRTASVATAAPVRRAGRSSPVRAS